MDRREKPPRDTAKDRRWTITVAGTLLWIIIGNAALHLNVAAVYGIAVVAAVILWTVTAPRT
ncbi:hypothetical protein ACFPIJ_32515 [Dactylosporangium cerinum]|uniref:Uncharacterized protein n=1 Tax=Dactylosporangium cerinum TaxID=1434730 RepID=A0ABV9W4P1_9ACTN